MPDVTNEESTDKDTRRRRRRLSTDQPITGRASDRLGRARLAEIIATEVLEGPGGDGFVIALHGDWGSGKTSILNMVQEYIADRAAVVTFNPWLFSEAEQLVDRFLSEVSTQLQGDQRLAAVRVLLSDYRDVVTPVAPLVLGRFGGIAATLTEAAAKRRARRRGGARDAYERLEKALREADRRIVAILDDIDRLTPHEIREVIRLVKAVGDLPNVTYLLAFSRTRVERALALEEQSGAEYLEKIVQLSHSVPPIPPAVLRQFALEALGETLDGYDLNHFDSSAWSLVFQQGIAPMLVTVRDAYRLANAAPAIVTLVGDEVATQDLLALEALRIFAADFHARLPRMVDVLACESRLDLRDRSTIDREHAERVELWLELAPDDRREHIKHVMRLLFPSVGHHFGGSRYGDMSRTWRKNRRVADADVLAAYVHHTFSEGETATADVVRIVESLGDADRLKELLQRVPDDHLPSLLDRIRDYEDEFATQDMEAAAHVFLGLLPRMPDEREFFQMPPEWALHFAVETFLRRLPDEEHGPATERLFRGSQSLSQRFRILNWFGAFPERENRRSDREFLGEQATRRLAEELSQGVVKADAAQLADEPLLVTLLAMTLDLDEAHARQAIVSKADDDRFYLRLLQGCVRTGRSGDGDGVVQRIVRFDWDALVRLVGEPVARERLAAIEDRLESDGLSAEEREAIQLARLYARGEGPEGDDWLRAGNLSVTE